ncbi:MAG TPA: AAA family ATPase [Candidatus Gallibacteroides avistercoris]|uniref:AAA family ATPase n=1 Tax=Candidatus Gallibacteroides avistercoris TaxID=2840833 RepID=A0A9D1M7U7_9BACT|nr:AAA family ATPase [Candidatus Gallibacteroides avistercoris]
MVTHLLSDRIKKFLDYDPTPEQLSLMERLSSFVLEGGDDSLFLLKGYAGTGKTSVIGCLVRALEELGYKTILLAPTGRAAKVFGLYAAHTAFTIHKVIYRQKMFTADYEGFQVAPNLHKNTLFVVDEASMISTLSGDSVTVGSGNLLSDLIEYVYSGEHCRLILCGDTAQLPPIGQSDSRAMSEEELATYALTVFSFELKQVARQKNDSGILYNATRLRLNMEQEPIPVPQIRTRGYGDIQYVSGVDMVELLSSVYDRDGMDEAVVITRSNKRANLFNQGIRSRILYREEELSAGDLLLVAKNNYFWSEQYKEIDFVANGDIARVVRVSDRAEMYGFRFADVSLFFPDYEVEMDVKVLLDTLTADTPALSTEQNQRLFLSVYEDYADLHTKQQKMRAIKKDPYFNALQVKYGYAVTCHKAQGGQWKNVFVDMGVLSPEAVGKDFYRWLYTAMTRATGRLYLMNVGNDFRPDDEKEEW